MASVRSRGRCPLVHRLALAVYRVSWSSRSRHRRREFGEVPVDVGDLLGLVEVGPFGAELALLFVEGVEVAAEPDHVGAWVGVGEFVVELGEGAGFGGVDGDGDELVVQLLCSGGEWDGPVVEGAVCAGRGG